MAVDNPWWRSAVLYQIYPRSFQDSTGDGVGDLDGIQRRLDYLCWLGVDAVWLSPIFPSPMADFGYDVADYTGVDPLFGDLDALDRLLEACHERGLKLLLDLVPNHSSSEHAWFKESRSSLDNPKRDWYIWHDPGEEGGPPSNWLSVFGGSAWEWDEATGQYYLHSFLKEQPDLNWRNPAVKEAMLDVMRFWFDRGVDGFRIDVLWHIFKDEQLRDNPANPDYDAGEVPYNTLAPVFTTDQPEVHDVAAEMRTLADAYGARLLIGELYLPIERLVTYYGQDDDGVHLPFNFQLITAEWNARRLDLIISEYEGSVPSTGWPNWVLSNHDQSRISSRVGAAQARVAAFLLLTLRGTPTLYYGDELGLADVPVTPEQVQDPQGLRLGVRFSRDPSRTPMAWEAAPGGGFTDGEPWLPLHSDCADVNVEAQKRDPASMLSLHHRLLALRRERPALALGGYTPLHGEEDVLAYIRELDGDALLVVLNLGGRAQGFDLHARTGAVLLGTHADREGEKVEDWLTLRPDEAVIIEIEG